MALLARFAGSLSCALKRLALACTAPGLLLIAGPTPMRAQPRTVSEYDIKAVFLFNFLQFVDWPAAADKKTLVIGVLGKDPFGARLDEVVLGEHVNQRTLEVRRLKSVDDVAGCDALFIALSEQAALPQILKRLDRAPVLTVSDIPGFAELGGMIGLVADGDKIRLQINVDASRLATLSISGKLLRPAQIVSTRKSSWFYAAPPVRLFADWAESNEVQVFFFLVARAFL